MSTKIERKTGTKVDTIMFTREQIEQWTPAPFQRDEVMNAKVQDLVEKLKADGGVLPGIISFGILGEKEYLIDGLQRRSAFIHSEIPEGYADVRYVTCENMAEMADEFVRLNGHLVSMKPDDILRALEFRMDPLRKIRKACPFVGYGNVRRNERSPILSMSVAIRSWTTAGKDVPAAQGSASDVAASLTDQDAALCSEFLKIAHEAWGADIQYKNLWSSINLAIAMWMFRHTVVSGYSVKTTRLTTDQFRQCLMALSASQGYCEWLVGRRLGEHDRAACFVRMKQLFTSRLSTILPRKPMLPQPPWERSSK